MMNELSNILKRLRGNRSQADVASGARVSLRTYTRVELGQSLKISSLRQILSELEATEDDYLNAIDAWIKHEIGQSDYERISQRNQRSKSAPAILRHALASARKLAALRTEDMEEVLQAIESPEIIQCVRQLNKLRSNLLSQTTKPNRRPPSPK